MGTRETKEELNEAKRGEEEPRRNPRWCRMDLRWTKMFPNNKPRGIPREPWEISEITQERPMQLQRRA